MDLNRLQIIARKIQQNIYVPGKCVDRTCFETFLVKHVAVFDFFFPVIIFPVVLFIALDRFSHESLYNVIKLLYIQNSAMSVNLECNLFNVVNSFCNNYSFFFSCFFALVQKNPHNLVEKLGNK